MKYLKMLFLAAFACLVLSSCRSGDNMAVYKELLVEAVWHYEKAVPAEGITGYYLSFGEYGTVSVFPVTTKINPAHRYMYIYDPGKGSIVIEGYGIFEVLEINTDRLVLGNENGDYTLARIKEYIELPVTNDKQ